MQRPAATGNAAFTQEWPLFSQTHQISYTVPFGSAGDFVGVGDAALNYRLQAWLEGASRPAFFAAGVADRPSGNSSKGLGSGNPGWQVNLPFSKQFNDTYLHWNAGFTHTSPTARVLLRATRTQASAHASGAQGPMFNLMLESVVAWEEIVDGTTTRRDTVVTISPEGFPHRVERG